MVTSSMTTIAFFDKFQNFILINSFWVSFIGIYALLRILRVWGNSLPPLVQIGSLSTLVQIGLSDHGYVSTGKENEKVRHCNVQIVF